MESAEIYNPLSLIEISDEMIPDSLEEANASFFPSGEYDVQVIVHQGMNIDSDFRRSKSTTSDKIHSVDKILICSKDYLLILPRSVKMPIRFALREKEFSTVL